MMMMKPLSKEDYKMLRPAKAKELIPGGVWYLKDGDEFRTVVTDLEKISNLEGYKGFVRKMSKEGRIFLRRDKPNYPLTIESESFTKNLIFEHERNRRKKRAKASQSNSSNN